MRNKILIIFILSVLTVNSQVTDLEMLTNGKLLSFDPISELDNSVYGYLAIYKLEEISEVEEKYEYFLLDKNLNQVVKGEFVDAKYKNFLGKFYSPEKINNKLVISKKYFIDPSRLITIIGASKFFAQEFMSHRVLDLSTNKLSDSFYYDNGVFFEGIRDIENISKITKDLKTIDIPIAFNEGLFMLETVKSNTKTKDLKNIKSLKAYGIDKKKLWEYDFNLDKKKVYYSFKLLNDKNIIFWTKENKTKSVKLHRLDPKTGKPLFVYELENKSSEFSHKYVVKDIGDRTIIVGSYSSHKSYHDKNLGFFKIELDRKGNVLLKKYVPWVDFNNHIKISKNGKVNSGFKLYEKDFFVFSNNTISILTQKRKSNLYIDPLSTNVVNTIQNLKLNRAYTSDYVLLNFDANFNPIGAKVIEEKEEEDNKYYFGTKYLFSQMIKEGNKVTFLYEKIYNKSSLSTIVGARKGNKRAVEKLKKEMIPNKAVIVTVKDGQMMKEEIPLEDASVIPLVAKEGFLLLKEKNKQLRLERLNY